MRVTNGILSPFGLACVLLAANRPGRERGVKSACGVATRSATPTLDPAPAPWETGTYEKDGGSQSTWLATDCRQARQGNSCGSRPDALILEVRVLPAGQYDQRNCACCEQEQCNETGGLGVTCLGRPSCFLDQPF
jgi:hypothetical protein